CGGAARVDDDRAAPVEAPKDAIAKTTENGPVKVTARAWPAKPTLADPIYFRIEIEAPAGVAVDAPYQSVDEGLGRFAITSHARGTSRTADGGQREVQTYTLAAPSSGKHRI